MEDWSLVRTKDGQIGWVLTRNLDMSIPDEVAQYAKVSASLRISISVPSKMKKRA